MRLVLARLRCFGGLRSLTGRFKRHINRGDFIVRHLGHPHINIYGMRCVLEDTISFLEHPLKSSAQLFNIKRASLCETTRNNWQEAKVQIDQGTALWLLNIFKKRAGQKQSWRAVQRFLAKAEHPNAFLVSSQKLANWANPKRQTMLEPRAFAAVVHFIQTPEFQELVPEARNHLDQSNRAIEAGSLITELAGIHPPEETEEILFRAIDGMWCDRTNLVYLYIHKVKGHNFAIVHLCQKIHAGHDSALGFPIKAYVDFEAMGFLYFENETHSKNKNEFQGQLKRTGQIEKSTGDTPIYKIGVSGKRMHLKLWSRRARNEANFEASCHCSLSDSAYELTADQTISVSSFFELSFKTADADDVYRFDKANYVDASSALWAAPTVKNVGFLKEKFDGIKWSVLPNVIS